MCGARWTEHHGGAACEELLCCERGDCQVKDRKSGENLTLILCPTWHYIGPQGRYHENGAQPLTEDHLARKPTRVQRPRREIVRPVHSVEFFRRFRRKCAKLLGIFTLAGASDRVYLVPQAAHSTISPSGVFLESHASPILADAAPSQAQAIPFPTQSRLQPTPKATA
ncbi:MAG: hypothetical protein ACI81R_001785 [Bradymonadia bacterium]|jgi:hypothetical protein